MLIVTDT